MQRASTKLTKTTSTKSWMEVSVQDREEREDVTKEMVNFTGAERQVKGISGVNH